MSRIDISQNPRIPFLIDMVRALSGASDPRSVLEIFLAAMRRTYGNNSCYIGLSIDGLPPGQYRLTRWLSDAHGEHIAPTDLGLEPLTQPIRSGGFLSRVTADAEPKLFRELEIRDDPVCGNHLKDYGSSLAAPLFERGRHVAWAIVLRPEPAGLGTEDLEELIIRANLISATIDNALTNERLRSASSWIEHEVDQIAELQRSMLPRPLPSIPGLTIATSYKTFDRAGGDYYDLFPLSNGIGRRTSRPDERWGLFIADAAGHGPSAAIVVALLNGLLHATSHATESPSQVLEFLNHHLYARDMVTSFVTAFYGIYEPGSRRLTYARAGHNPPAIRAAGADAAVQWLDRIGGLPLGISEHIDSGEGSVVLSPGQTLVLYTDGVVEELCPRNTMFGQLRLEETLRACAGGPQELIDVLNTELIRHQAESRPDDDQTIVACRVD